MRLIDANALSEKIGKMKNEITHNRGGYRYCNEDEKNEWDKLDCFDSLVCDAPTVDAEEVVRCEKCDYYDESGEYCKHWHGVRHPEHFCDDGERRTK